MIKINLKSYYPFYTADCLIEVEDRIAQLLKMLNRKEHADFERRRIYKAYYSLDACDGIEMKILEPVSSPHELYELKQNRFKLYSAINSLPEKQAKRIYAHFFLCMSKAAIAKMDGVRESAIRESIERGLRNIEKILRNLS